MTFLLITAATASAAFASLALFALRPEERRLPVRVRDDKRSSRR